VYQWEKRLIESLEGYLKALDVNSSLLPADLGCDYLISNQPPSITHTPSGFF